MNDPYKVLGLNRSADEAAIRRRYLELVREFSPERAPERFTEIRNAYEVLRDPIRRLQTRLFEPDVRDSLDTVLAEARKRLRTRRIPTDTLLNMAVQP